MQMLVYICLFYRMLLILTRIKHFEINKKYLYQMMSDGLSIGLLIELLIYL